jgi:hypothetical protein
MAAESPESPKERRPVAEYFERVWSQALAAYEQTVEDRLRATLASLKLPRRDDLRALEARLDAAGARLDALERKGRG